MKERPILFSGPMVRAILDASKTMTRRVVKPQPLPQHDMVSLCGSPGNWMFSNREATMKCHCEMLAQRRCPYGQPGDRLWVRETWLPHPLGWKIAYYRADGNTYVNPRTMLTSKWRPSIHMPRWASRITLEVTGVRVERVADISEEDAKAEGIRIQKRNTLPDGFGIHDNHYRETAKLAFMDLWNSINAARGYGWDVDPWVWVVEFRRVKQ
jgi:hypothetical protein